MDGLTLFNDVFIMSEPVGASLCGIFHFVVVDLVRLSSKHQCQIGFMDAASKNEPECYILCTA